MKNFNFFNICHILGGATISAIWLAFSKSNLAIKLIISIILGTFINLCWELFIDKWNLIPHLGSTGVFDGYDIFRGLMGSLIITIIYLVNKGDK